MESVGSAFDDFDEIVDAFRYAIGNTMGEVGKNAVGPAIESCCQIDERNEIALSATASPFLEESGGLFRSVAGIECFEIFLENVCATKTTVDFHDLC